jgi:signal transduction histidine kinase
VSSLSWVTVVWAMIASASLTLAAIYWLVWYRNRTAWAHLLFSITAVSLSAFTFCELWLMRAETPRELLVALKWAHLALFFLLVSLTWFVAMYLRAGRLWLAWVACGMRAIFVLLNFVGQPSLNFTEITPLRHVQFLGESVTILGGVPNPVQLLGQLAVVLILIFVADATVTSWRRGNRRAALAVGGSVEFFLLTSLATSMAVIWGHVQAPLLLSLWYLGLVAVMAYELSTEVLRASQLVHELRSTEAGLREHQATLEASNKQISDLFGRLIAAQETERTRIARDLHDDVSQRIAGLSIMISGVKRRLRGEPNEGDVMPALMSIQQSTTELADEIRQFSHDLHPILLQHAGLGAALRVICAEFEKLHAITVTCSSDVDTPGIEDDTALCLYRITQEGLRNVAKHAEAQHVGVTLTATTDGVQLSIVDDGKGFDLAGVRGTGAGLGLVSIDERARLLRGSVRIDTEPEKGTRLDVQIPSPQNVAADAWYTLGTT